MLFPCGANRPHKDRITLYDTSINRSDKTYHSLPREGRGPTFGTSGTARTPEGPSTLRPSVVSCSPSYLVHRESHEQTDPRSEKWVGPSIVQCWYLGPFVGDWSQVVARRQMGRFCGVVVKTVILNILGKSLSIR